jgi:hypothetical protein
MEESIVFFLLMGGGAFAAYRFWCNWKAQEEAAARVAAEEREAEAERRRRKVERLKQEERARKAEERLKEFRRQQQMEEEAKAREAERKRLEELECRKEEMARIEEEERRLFEEQRREKEREVDLFIAKYIKPLVETKVAESQTLDDDIALKRRIFSEGTQVYRARGYYDDFTFQQRVSTYLKEFNVPYQPARDTPTEFSFYVPLIEAFRHQILEYAAVEYFYAKKSETVHYGNLKGNRDLGVDMILTQGNHCALVSCISRPKGAEKITTQMLIDLNEKLEMYARDFLLQAYPEFEEMDTGFILVVGGRGTEDMDVEAYSFAKTHFERVLTIQGIVAFLDFEQPREKAKEKYLDPIVGGE